jgi:hypothetical protein
MKFALSLLIVFGAGLAACGLESIEHSLPDGGADAAVDGGTGSGSAARDLMEPSPRDFDLEVVVLGASLVVAIVPIPELRRRRRALRESDAIKPHFT